MTDPRADRIVLRDGKPAMAWTEGATDPRAALAEVLRYYRRHPLDEHEAAQRLAERGVLLVPTALIDQLRTGTLPGSTDQEKAGIQYAFMWLKKQLQS